jgi:hypothetical protein
MSAVPNAYRVQQDSHFHRLKHIILQNTQEATTRSAAPSKCIHSNTQEFHMNRTGTGKQHSINQHRAKLLQTLIRGHAHASPEAGATRPSQHTNRCSIRQETTPAQTYTQLPQGATKDDRETPPGPAASSPRSCKTFIAGWPRRP